jgi:hypothetical protein
MYVIGYYITITILFYLLRGYLYFIKTDYTSILLSDSGLVYRYSGYGRVALTLLSDDMYRADRVRPILVVKNKANTCREKQGRYM